jgi:hypothetical protein
MNLIEKYITEVGKHLPRRQRADIEAEIRSTLEDMLEERRQAKGQDDEALVVELLKEYGEPRKVAASYHPTPYLIGPRLFPIFEMVVKIVLSVLLGVMVLMFGFTVVRSGMTQPEMVIALGKLALQFLSGAIAAFGNIVLVFAIIERVAPATKFEIEEDEKWDPLKLAKEPDPDRVKIGEEIFEIIFSVAFLIVFNAYPDKVGFIILSDETWAFFPVLTDAFFRYLPWLNLIAALQIGLNVYLLREGIWQTSTRLASLTLKLGTALVAFFMLTGPAIIAITPEAVAGTPLAAISPDTLETLSGFVLIPLFLAIFIATAVESVQIIIQLLNRRIPAPFEAQK